MPRPFGKQAKVLALCKTLIDLGDDGPYAGLIMELQTLIRCLRPKRLPSGRGRDHAKSLRKLIKGLLKRIKRGAMKKLTCLAQIVETELSGQGGCQLYKRLDAQLASLAKVPPKIELPSYEYKNDFASSAFRGGSVGQRGNRRGSFAARRGASRGRDARGNIICYGCNMTGHIRSQCPGRNANADGADDNA